MFKRLIHFPSQPTKLQSAAWIRFSLIGLHLMLLVAALLGMTIIGCRVPEPIPTPIAPVTPTPTFTPTPPSQSLPSQSVPTLLPSATTEPTITPIAVVENVQLPATLYFLGIDGQIWSVDKETRQHQQITFEAYPIVDYDFSPIHKRFVFVSNNQLIEFDPATNQRMVKLTTPNESELWTMNENGFRICAQCDTEQVLAPRYSPDGSQIAYAKGGINLMGSGLEQNAPSRLLQPNVRFQIDTEDVNATRFYDDSLWSPDGVRIAFHARAWEWTGYEIYDLNQNQLQIVRSPTVPGVQLCCQWQWGKDSVNGYITAPLSHGPIPDSGVYRVTATDASVVQLNSGKHSSELVGQLQDVSQRGVVGVHQNVSGELLAFISVNDDKWITQPTLYTLHRIDPNGGEPTAVNERQTFIEGEVLWATDGSGALVMTASFSPPGKTPIGKFVWMQNSAEYSYPQSLALIGSHLRWGAETTGVENSSQPVRLQQKMAYVSEQQLIITTYPQEKIYVADQCTHEQTCNFSRLGWSPTGTHLAYFKSIFTSEGTNTGLYVLDEDNQSHLLTITTSSMLNFFKPAWSPDGKSLAYIVGTMNVVQLPETTVSSTTGINSGNLVERSEVWVSHFPFANPGERRGSIEVFTGFGGYPRTKSEELYWKEGLSSESAGVGLQLYWLPTDVLLFTRSPLQVGIGQFDMHSGQELEPLDQNELRQFAIHLPSQQLAAWTWNNQIALGNIDGTMIMTHAIPGITEPKLTSPMTGSVSVGAVFFGPTSDRLYFTTRAYWGSRAMHSAHYLKLYADLMLFSAIPAAFDVYHTALFAVNEHDFTQVQRLLEGDDYGYGSLTEAVNGDILFVRIENDIPLLEAIQAQLPAEEVIKHIPRASIMRLAASSGKLETVVANAGQLALAPPQ